MKHHRKQYRSIFLSDIHIGTKRSKVEYALDFLKNQEFEYLYLVGAIICGIAMKRNEGWGERGGGG